MKFKKLKKRLSIFILVYLILLSITILIGKNDIERLCISKLESKEKLKNRRFSVDSKSLEIPWYTLENCISPIPFLVVFEYGYVTAPLCGMGGNVYYFWFFGLKIQIKDSIDWLC